MKLKVENFSLEETLENGQCFRANKIDKNEYSVIIKDRVLILKQIDNYLHIDSNNMDNIKDIVLNYLGLNIDYDKINKHLSNDIIMKECVKKCTTYRIMNQDFFEMCISYIISQFNNVNRIKKAVEKISVLYGTKIKYKDKIYYLFPTYNQLKNITLNELKNLGVGFRSKYIIDFLSKYKKLDIDEHYSTDKILNELMRVEGIGIKVASCILLFGYKRFDVFPVDTWVKKFMKEKYNIDSTKVKKFAYENYGEYSGVALQYMFHSQRNKNNM